MQQNDLIAALGTTLGEAAIGIVRLSGEGAVELAAAIFKPRKKELDLTKIASHTLHLGYICDDEGDILDEVLIAVMRAPRSYTRDDVVEIYCHGGIIPVRRVLDLVLKKGARLAEPGEFTKRAFLSGRIDLAQAEAVLDLIRAQSNKGAELACRQLRGGVSDKIKNMRDQLKRIMAEIEAEIDFPDDVDPVPAELRAEQIKSVEEKAAELVRGSNLGRIYREGLRTVLLGKPNVGKSTLLNLLLDEERALVTEVPGTTRDLIEEMLVLEGIPLRIIDTAGIREGVGLVEALGIERAKKAVEEAELVLAVFDAADEITEDDLRVFELLKGKKAIILLNKVDLKEKKQDPRLIRQYVDEETPIIEISAKTGWGKEKLVDAIVQLIGGGQVSRESDLITRKRHQIAMEKVVDRLQSAIKGVEAELPLEFIALDLWDAWSALGEITGETALPEEVINSIFEEFCIGK
ncbi:MAG: tRNA uridine-5-carboxymethylaminomethyl(34) synthesis GTPase MnmE [Thermacetogeniaceae bacterium]|nr:tRNA uridine-5-carboxymethylaminomethyl(34) synthesis GTPase MnmE [Syntrophomonadaceae bacterium]